MVNGIECSVFSEVVFVLHELVVLEVLPLIHTSMVMNTLDNLLTSLSVNHFLEFTTLRSFGQKSSVATFFISIFIFVLFNEIHHVHFL